MPTAFSARQETMRNIAATLSKLDVPIYQVGPLPGENGVRVEFRTEPDSDDLETAIHRVANVYNIACERYPWTPDICRIIARSPTEDGGALWTIEQEWLPSGPIDSPEEGEAQEMLDRIEDTMEVF